jgi:16S rRNA (cytidine1402-2'-O)-methyltransferase
MSKLYLVPTPIGNLEDMTFRAIRILKEVDYILAEDTRTSGFLLKHFEIETKMFSHHKFNEHKSVDHIAERILAGESFALISDAGTPSVSDPGFLLVKTCVSKGVDIECLPGATALIPALAVSGLPSDRFCFEGFLPPKKGRNKKMQALVDEDRTMIFYESPFRLVKTLELFKEYLGEDRIVSVSREISKFYEETKRGTIEELIELYTDKTVKGEIVIVVAGKS